MVSVATLTARTQIMNFVANERSISASYYYILIGFNILRRIFSSSLYSFWIHVTSTVLLTNWRYHRFSLLVLSFENHIWMQKALQNGIMLILKVGCLDMKADFALLEIQLKFVANTCIFSFFFVLFFNSLDGRMLDM